MRCRDAKTWLNVQRDGDLELPRVTIATDLQKDLRQCDVCRESTKHPDSVEVPGHASVAPMQASISTDQIMYAVKQQQRITRQLEELRQQQRLRIERIRTVGAMGVAISIFILSSIPLIILVMLILQTDVVVNALSVLNNVLDVFFILIQYLQNGLTMLTYNNWLLSGFALAMVVMMGMWLRLMRPPREA
jgi:hypothetical protein